MDTPDEVTGPINIGNPGEISVRQLAELVIAKTGAKVELEICDLPADDPKQRQPDITRARELLSWEPRVPLDQGLDLTIDYFRELTGEAVVRIVPGTAA
jgi:UDP-glucuronate decarboxylase